MNRWAAATAIGVMLIAGCGGGVTLAGHSSTPSAAGAEPGVDTYLCKGNTWADLFQWRNSSGDLSGTFQDANLSGTPPQEQVSSNSGDLSGTLDGSAITVNIGASQPIYGNLSGRQVTLNVPQSDGTIQGVTCHQSSVSDWNNAIATLNSQAGSDNQQENQAQASASASVSVAQQESSAQGDVSTLLQDAGSLSGDVNAVTGDVKSTGSDLSSERSDAANGNGDQCTNVQDTVYNDAASTIYNDVLSAAYNDVIRVSNDIATVRKDISTVQGDQAALSNAGLSGAPGAASAISAVQSAISSVISGVNRYIDHLNGDLDAAYQIADSLGTGGCAGDGPGQPPQGLSHLK